jgi:hypothetical protein
MTKNVKSFCDKNAKSRRSTKESQLSKLPSLRDAGRRGLCALRKFGGYDFYNIGTEKNAIKVLARYN